MNNNDITIRIQKKLESGFLSSFARQEVDYFNIKDSTLLEAYQSGIYDATVNFIGESHFKITGISKTIEEVKTFFKQTSFNGSLSMKDHQGNIFKTFDQQENLVDAWFQENNGKNQYTQLILMIPKDNDRAKLANIVHEFLPLEFNDNKYIFVEHTDTNIYHYHIIVNKYLSDDMILKLKSNFINVCIKNQARLL